MPAIPAPATSAILDYFQVVVRPPDRSSSAGYLLPRFSSLNITGGKHGGGDGTLSFWDDGHPMIAALLNGAGWGWTVDVYYNDLSTPLWVGTPTHAVINVSISRAPMVTLRLEAVDSHIVRRRLNESATNATVDIVTVPADNAIRRTLAYAMGGITPSGYPVAATRTAWGNGAVNSVSVESEVAPGDPIKVSLSQESGNGIGDIIYGITERQGYGLALTEATAGAWFWSVNSTFQTKDLTGLRLSDVSGEISDFSWEIDWSALANLFKMGGGGKGASQVLQWLMDNPSYASYGGYEDSSTASQVTNTTALSDLGTTELARVANPIETYTITLRDRPGALWSFNKGGSMNVGTLLRIESSYLAGIRPKGAPEGGKFLGSPVTTDQHIVGYTLSAQGYTRPTISLVLGAPKRHLLWEMRKRTGSRGGRQAGDWRSPNHGG